MHDYSKEHYNHVVSVEFEVRLKLKYLHFFYHQSEKIIYTLN
jgi:hypothetical protein